MDNLRHRGFIVSVFIGLIYFIYIIRLFSIQVLNKKYEEQANDNVIKNKTITPARGTIFDRDTVVYVANTPEFDLMVTMKELVIPDTAHLCNTLGITKEELVRKLLEVKARRDYSSVKDVSFLRNIAPIDRYTMEEQMWDYYGFSFTQYNTRNYLYPVGAGFLGYISEVDSNQIKKIPDNHYQNGDLAGKAGIEKFYETELLGKKGRHLVLKDVHNREVGSYMNGEQDEQEVPGKSIMLGIDLELQKLGEELMHNKKGSIVAIEPSTGEILAFVSAPTFDPNMLSGTELKKNWKALQSDPNKPLYTRPTMATYPPGSIFKLAMALAALNDGVIQPYTHYGCGGGFSRNRGKPHCHGHAATGGLNGAIQYSCNSYFAAVYFDYLMNHPKYPDDMYKAYGSWYNYMVKLGIGQKLKIDLPSEKSGQVPSAEMYDNPKRWYGHGKWVANTIISNSIGQGEILMTPLQMANLTAIIANRGYYIQPHIVKAAKGVDNKWETLKFPRVESGIAKEHYETIINAMADVVRAGTGKRAALDNVQICGKTGTVQNPHGGDHSVFICFAPKDNPKIAMGVIIENAGASGGSWAAPLCGVMIEKYLSDTIVKKKVEYQRVKSASFLR